MGRNVRLLTALLLLGAVISLAGCVPANTFSGGSTSSSQTQTDQSGRTEQKPKQQATVSYPVGPYIPPLPQTCLTPPQGPVPGPGSPSVNVQSNPSGAITISITSDGGTTQEAKAGATVTSSATTKPSGSGQDLPGASGGADGSWTVGFKGNEVAANAKAKSGPLLIMVIAGLALIWPIGKYAQGILILFLAFAFLSLPTWVYYVGIVLGAFLIIYHYRSALIQKVAGEVHAVESGAINPEQAKEVASYAAEKMDSTVQALVAKIQEAVKDDKAK